MLQRGQKEKEYMIRAVWPEYEVIRDINIEQGRWLNADDDKYSRRVAVIGATLAREMFGSRTQIGEEILVNGIRFNVIGRLRTKVQIANYNRPDNECIFIPYETVKLFRNVRYPDNMVWTPITPSVREKAMKQVWETLAGIHRFSPIYGSGKKETRYIKALFRTVRNRFRIGSTDLAYPLRLSPDSQYPIDSKYRDRDQNR